MQYYDSPPRSLEDREQKVDISRLSPAQRKLLKSIPEYERQHVAEFLCRQQYLTENAAYHKYVTGCCCSRRVVVAVAIPLALPPAQIASWCCEFDFGAFVSSVVV